MNFDQPAYNRERRMALKAAGLCRDCKEPCAQRTRPPLGLSIRCAECNRIHAMTNDPKRGLRDLLESR